MNRLEYKVLNNEQKKLLGIDILKFKDIELLCINTVNGEFSLWGKKENSVVPIKNIKDKDLLIKLAV